LDFRRSQETTTKIDGEEQEASKIEYRSIHYRVHPSYHEESMGPMNPPIDEETRPRWLQDTLRDVERHAAPRDTFRESRPL
jgi:hypothetical protein